ncbi:hypothetical protein JCM8547_002386 [Rhodosporidiobolus lusitaniae]
MKPRTPRPRRLSASSSSASRLAALVIASSSLLLSGGLAASLHAYTSAFTREVDVDGDAVDGMDEGAVVAWWAGDAALRWALLSFSGSALGTLGLLLRNSRLHRVFAISTAVDLLATVLLTLVLLLLTFSPALSQPFSTFLCSSAFSPPSSSSTTSSSPTSSSDTLLSSSSPSLSLSLSLTDFWTLDTCEDNWRTGMICVLFGCFVACVLRAVGVWVTWETNGELREQELRDKGEGWVDEVDEREMEEQREEGEEVEGDGKKRRMSFASRPRSSSSSTVKSTRSSSSNRRSSTLPLYSEYDPREEGQPSQASPRRLRSQTLNYPLSFSSSRPSSSSKRPQLVLVPCVLDQNGHPVFSPSSPSFAIPPPYASPPRSRSNTSSSSYITSSSSSSSRSSSRASRHSTSTLKPSSHSPLADFSASPDPESSTPLMAFTDEPEALTSSPLSSLTPTMIGQSSGTSPVDEKTAVVSRRGRSRSEGDGGAGALGASFGL